MRVVVLLAVLAVAYAKRYDGYQVLKFVPKTEVQLSLLKSWADSMDFWLEPTTVGREVHLLVDPSKMSDILAQLHGVSLAHDIHIPDVQKQIDQQFADIAASKADRPENFAYNYSTYNTYDDIMDELTNLARNHCPANHTCSTEVIGFTYERNAIVTLKLFRNDPPQPSWALWYDSQMHAREWLSGATLMNVINRIFLGTDEHAVHFRESYDWYFTPIMNPDGYKWTWLGPDEGGDRLWRKNRKPSIRGPGCIGTDLNRNYPHTWSDDGSSNVTCSETYMGDYAGSEEETIAVDAYAAKIRGNLVAWINFHTYGYYWLTPWGDCTLPDDHVTHQEPVYTAVCAAIEATHDTSWLCGNSCDVLYATSGSIIDHIKARHGVRWTHTPELRGNSFIAQEDQIPLSYEEIWNGLVAKIETMESIGLP